MRQSDYALTSDGVTALRLDSLDKRPVELEDIDGQALQVTERRVTGPEIVNGDLDAEGTKLLHLRGGFAHVANDQAFGQLQFQETRFKTTALQYFINRANEIGAAELHRRHIHRHALEGYPALPAAVCRQASCMTPRYRWAR